MGDVLMLQGIYPFQLPEVPTDKSLILNFDKPIEEQYWQRLGPPKDWNNLNLKQRQAWIELESERCFITGVWIMIKGKPVWLTPFFYWFLQWWYTTDGYFQFRKFQLLEEYFEVFCEEDRWCVGTLRFKKRRDGLTTRRMARTIWKAIQTRNGWFGMQSKTGKDVKETCWHILMTGFEKLPAIFLPTMSGNTDPKTKLQFKKPSERITKSNQEDLFSSDLFRQEEDSDSLNTMVDWRDTTADAYDGQRLAEITIDEFDKWVKASSIDAIYTYIKSCTLDGIKVGMIHAISSPSERNTKQHNESIEMWEACDYTKIKDEPTFKIYRWFTSALDSYAGAIDKYGDCDRAIAKQMILAERNAAPERKRKQVIRQTPMYIDEIIDSVENDVFMCAPEIKTRRKFLQTIDYKDDQKTDRKYIFCNADWKDGIPDTTVIWRPSENQEDFSWTGRFCMSRSPKAYNEIAVRTKMVNGKEIKIMPQESENVLGVDPFDFRRTDSDRPSTGAGMLGQCFDFYNEGGVGDIMLLYDYRPRDPNVFYEDMIKAAVAYQAFINPESRNMKFVDYAEDRGYFDWILPKDMSKKKKKNIKGSPTTVNLIQEMCTLIETFLSTHLAQLWYEMVCEELILFDPENTKRFNKVMAMGHMLLGFAKRRRFHKKKPMATEETMSLAASLRDCYI